MTDRSTHRLLACGVLAGPIYVVVSLVNALTRDGFDLRRHPISLLSNGDLGWIQTTVFIVSGVLVIAGAIGLRRTMEPGGAAFWGPLLLGVYGLGLVGAGVFKADPALGFPSEAPAGMPDAMTTAGLLHFAVSGVGFFALIAGTLVFARRFARLGQTAWVAFSVATGVVFFAAFAGVASGSGAPALNLAFGAAVVLVWVWISALSARWMSASTTGG